MKIFVVPPNATETVVPDTYGDGSNEFRVEAYLAGTRMPATPGGIVACGDASPDELTDTSPGRIRISEHTESVASGSLDFEMPETVNFATTHRLAGSFTASVCQ